MQATVVPSVGYGWLQLECAELVCSVHKEEWPSPCVEHNCELMGKMCVRDGLLMRVSMLCLTSPTTGRGGANMGICWGFAGQSRPRCWGDSIKYTFDRSQAENE